jgi:hypothetical protein
VSHPSTAPGLQYSEHANRRTMDDSARTRQPRVPVSTDSRLGSESADKVGLLAKPVFPVEERPVSAPEAPSHNPSQMKALLLINGLVAEREEEAEGKVLARRISALFRRKVRPTSQRYVGEPLPTSSTTCSTERIRSMDHEKR